MKKLICFLILLVSFSCSYKFLGGKGGQGGKSVDGKPGAKGKDGKDGGISIKIK